MKLERDITSTVPSKNDTRYKYMSKYGVGKILSFDYCTVKNINGPEKYARETTNCLRSQEIDKLHVNEKHTVDYCIGTRHVE